MGHGRDKPKREKRRPKKDKVVLARTERDNEVLRHVAQHVPPAERTQ